MPKYNYDEEREETVRPHKVNKDKSKGKKSDHKHDYESKIAVDFLYTMNYYLVIKTCKVCGREGDRKLVKKDE